MTFAANVIRGATSGVNIHGRDNTHPSQPASSSTDNIVAHNTYGIAGTGVGTGTQALDALFPGAVVRRNVIVGGSSAQYPRDNFFVGSWAQIKFEDLAQGRVRLTRAAPFDAPAWMGPTSASTTAPWRRPSGQEEMAVDER